MKRRWKLKPQSPDLQQHLSKTLNISPTTAQVLINRNITEPESIRLFLKGSLKDLPDPFLLKDMDRAVKRLTQALRQQESVLLYGDYDVDGTTGVALLYLFLKSLGASVAYHIPDRNTEGYGLNKHSLRDIAQKGHSLIITIDNGTAATEELRESKKMGLDVIVLDHHECLPEDPPALALINPKHPSSRYPDRDLASVGICFNLAIALRSHLRQQGFFEGKKEPSLKDSLDLVALGTVADIVPLKGINRIFVRYGLEEIKAGHRLGLRTLTEISGTTRDQINTGSLGFRLGPRINAAGRLAHAKEAVELFITDHPVIAQEQAQKLDHLNHQRQALEDKMVEEALLQATAQEKQPAIVVASEKWHPGIIGIVASKLVDKFYRPAAVIALKEGLGKGSLRSIPGCPLFDILSQCRETLLKFGGHQSAAGITLSLDQIGNFTSHFRSATEAYLSEESKNPVLPIDAPLNIQDISPTLLEELGQLAPFGYGNPEPNFLFKDVFLEKSRTVGKNHLKTTLKQGALSVPAIGFDLAKDWADYSGPCSLIGLPQWNEWQGERSLQIKIKDIAADYKED
ncbi:MAG: single-stranded-DNA-specific exonuclease RecJ [Deltaproteobacteria bacterium RIFCSPLOWO2_02_FULL_50_16]|nr:MAG: single-stranded-DNA-specific exonuclease RecJ [Deltaproteobacteria bacterium GWA2_50_8]OGQ29479.1 MAG: single-stranded-DNA-specific exonuclease RecJ [Deltaproteobacteria bacterium RIFCSPHIGHO2_02_FULL_50_15]OGQ58299.1 MAG: single-stranded-DNA-specific exonuclease RecJ [Deltaproteobacteria bacterium RIFCSPLOWO2_02_FULL_50_16]OGQ66635.1 MAG: single-stranded-DNA-specific exonuclease RecJ [Deltaproteobacteria bacterium RIFCSPLOWO2_12_FULL_50_11]